MGLIKKKICIVIPTHWSAQMGGSQYQAKCLIDALIKKDKYEIYYVTRNSQPNFQTEGYQLIDIGSSKFAKSYGFYLDYFKLKAAFDKIKPDVIYQRVGGAYTGISAYYAKKNQCEMVWHIAHDSDVEPYFQQKLLRGKRCLDKKILEYGIRNASNIIAQTNDQANRLLHNYGKKATFVLKNFHPIPEKEAVKSNEIKVIWVANLKKTKQPEIFINLAQAINQLKIKADFIMIGKESEDKEWQQSFEKEASSISNVEYLGSKTIDEVNNVLRKGHIFVNTSESEGFANTYIQSWLREVPVISLNCNPENIFDHNNIGRHSGTFEQMIKDVTELIKDHSLRQKMGEEAKEYALKNHTLRNAEKLLSLFND